MKHYLATTLLTFLALNITGCGQNKSDCAKSKLVGGWVLSDQTVVSFQNNCKWASTKCNHVGTYSDLTKSNQFDMTIDQSSCEGDLGDYSCQLQALTLGGIQFQCVKNGALK